MTNNVQEDKFNFYNYTNFYRSIYHFYPLDSKLTWDNNFIYIKDIKKFIKELRKYIINKSSNGNEILGLECEVVNKKKLLNFIKLMVGNELI